MSEEQKTMSTGAESGGSPDADQATRLNVEKPAGMAPVLDNYGEMFPEHVFLWVEHLNIHLTEHDIRHAGLALRSAWPIVRDYVMRVLNNQCAQLTALRAELNDTQQLADEWTIKVCQAEQRALAAEAKLAGGVVVDRGLCERIVLLMATYASCGMESKYADGTKTPNAELCEQIVNSLGERLTAAQGGTK